MSGYSYSDEIHASFELLEKQLRRHNYDAAIEEIDNLRKIVAADLDALAFEAAHWKRETDVLGELPTIPLTLDTCEICQRPCIGSRCDHHKAD